MLHVLVIKCRALSGSKLVDKRNIYKQNADDKNHAKLTKVQKVHTGGIHLQLS